jgi:hypothetical protein
MANQIFSGFLYDDGGDAVQDATVNLYERNSTSPSRADTTTNSAGYWSISHSTEGRFDVEITSGSSKRRIKYDDERQFTTLEVANLNIRNPANTFDYSILPAAIVADRVLTLPLITATDTLPAIGLAQTWSAVQTHSANISLSANADIAFTGTSGTNDITLTDSLADALSITRGGTNMVLFDSSTPRITFTPITTFTGTITGPSGTWDSGGVDIAASDSYAVDGTAILSDSSGTMTLSNVDALDSTTEATIEGAIDTLANLVSVGTITTGVWNGTAITGAYINDDIISGQSEITSGLATADELLYSDGGTVKRVGLDTLTTYLAGVNAGTVTSTGLSDSSGVLTLDIQNMTVSTTIADADLIAIDDGAGGTLRKMTRANFIESAALDAINIDGGAIDGTVIGANTAAAGTFAAIAGTTGTFSGVLSVDDSTESTSTTTGSIHTDGGLGVAKDIYAGDDIFLTSGAVINFDSGDVTLTHAANKLTFGGAVLEIDFVNHEMTNVDIDSGAIDGVSIGATTKVTSIQVDEDGLDVDPTGDADADLITVGVTGAPTMKWDESEDVFAFDKDVSVGGQLVRGLATDPLFNQLFWGPVYEATLTLLGSTGTIFPMGDPKHGAASATTFTSIGGEQVTCTWSKAPNSFDNALDLTAVASYQGLVPIVHFDATDEEWDTPDTAYFTRTAGAWSVGMWINADTVSSFQVLMSKWDETSGSEIREWMLFINSGVIELQLSDESANARISRKVSTARTAGTWYHVVGTHDGGTASSGIDIYIDGEVADDTDNNAGSFTAIENLGAVVKLAHRTGSSGVDGFFDGKCAGGPCAPFWVQKELTSDEVRRMYQLQRRAMGLS